MTSLLVSPRTRQGTVRLATEADHESIHRLNYQTFVDEIPQHAPAPDRRLVDRFHDENVYAVYEVEGRIVGMVCGRPQRPFSLDQKLGPIDHWLPSPCTPVEIRLLAVEPSHRSSRVFAHLMRFITQHFMSRGHDVGVISGTTRQLGLYQQLGFMPFGPLIGTEGARYQPMFITADQIRAWPAAMFDGDSAPGAGGNFLPGPVAMSAAVRAAFAKEATSHRAAPFQQQYVDTQRRLCALTGARHATMLLGSGTLANDVIGAQLLRRDGAGIVLCNGEFGERLADHAMRWGLRHQIVRAAWGTTFDWEMVTRAVHDSAADWIWAVHTETSTGVVNDLALLKSIAQAGNARLALDAISSVGAVPVDLRDVWCASAVSGKALGSFAGVAMVLHDDSPQPAPLTIPRYLDLGLAAAHDGVPFTQSSNLLDALHTSLAETDWDQQLQQRERDGRWLRGALERQGFTVLAPAANASPAVHTLTLPAHTSARRMGESLRRSGWLLSFESDYLLARNWIQVCLMGHIDAAALRALPPAMARAAQAARHG